MVCVFQIVGKKDSGKTSVIQKLIPLLKERGYIVGVIKHSHHVIDSENKDTFKFKQSGADIVIFHSNDCALFFDCSNFNYIQFLPVDILLIEGFKDLQFGYKIEIHNISEIETIVNDILDKSKECNESVSIMIDGKKAEKSVLTLLLFKLMKEYNIKEIKIDN